MDNMNKKYQDHIHISREEALSEHVDDLLNRQKSLTGSGGIKKEVTQKAWYLQNWFIFGIAGALAAFFMWLFIEQYEDDRLYIQGPIEELNLSEIMPQQMQIGNYSFTAKTPATGWIQINNQKIWLSFLVQEYRDGKAQFLDTSLLFKGREVGVYVDYQELSSTEGIAFAAFINPAPQHPAKPRATLKLSTLNRQNSIIGFFIFSLVAGAIGLILGAVEGVICHHYKRALLSGLIGMVIGLFGGLIFTIPAGAVYGMLNKIAMEQAADAESFFNPLVFFTQVSGRSLAWCLAGMAMGLGQGIATRSKRLLTYGFLGGLIGGLLGGLLFDPIDIVILGWNKPSAHISRMIGFTTIGLSVGVLVGIVQLLSRDYWLRMTEGPLAGKEFLIYKDSMTIGASPKCDIYLFNDNEVLEHHATLRIMGEGCEIECANKDNLVLINDRTLKQTKIRHGDRITIGRTSFIYETKRR